MTTQSSDRNRLPLSPGMYLATAMVIIAANLSRLLLDAANPTERRSTDE
jgi:hypothetical protein